MLAQRAVRKDLGYWIPRWRLRRVLRRAPRIVEPPFAHYAMPKIKAPFPTQSLSEMITEPLTRPVPAPHIKTLDPSPINDLVSVTPQAEPTPGAIPMTFRHENPDERAARETHARMYCTNEAATEVLPSLPYRPSPPAEQAMRTLIREIKAGPLNACQGLPGRTWKITAETARVLFGTTPPKWFTSEMPNDCELFYFDDIRFLSGSAGVALMTPDRRVTLHHYIMTRA